MIRTVAWGAVLLASGVVADEPVRDRFRHLEVEDGLSHNSVYAVIQDRVGFIWLGTEDGLDRYDGYEFVHLDQSRIEGLPSRDISNLYESSDGSIWIATWGGGILRYDPDTGTTRAFRTESDEHGALSEDRTQVVREDSAGRIWFGTYDGLDRLDPGAETLVHYRERADGEVRGGLPADRVWGIAECPEKRLWVGTETGLAVLDPETDRLRVIRAGDAETELQHRTVRTVVCDSHGRLWVGTENGLHVADPTPLAEDFEVPVVFERFLHDPADAGSLSQSTINVILEDSRDRIWVGTQHGGLNLFRESTKDFRRFISDPTNPESLSHFDVRALHEDRSGVLWVATRGGGVSLLDLTPPKFARAAFRADVPLARDEAVYAVEEESGGLLWVGTNRGLVRWDPEGGSSLFVRPDPNRPDSLPPDAVRALHIDEDGTLWVGTFNGLARAPLEEAAEGKFERIPSTSDAHRDLEIEDILRRSDGSLWVATRGGLDRYDPSTRQLEPSLGLEDGLVDERIWDLHEDELGRLWIGTDNGGLARLDPDGALKSWRHDPFDGDSLGDDRVYAIEAASDGGLWLGTGGGLTYFHPEAERFERWYTSDGLPSAVVHCAVEDEGQRVWLSTNRGLARLDPETREVLSYDESDGLQGLQFVPTSCLRTASGELVFGGFEGLSLVDPEDVQDHPVKPPVVLTHFSIFHRPVENGVPIHRRREIALAWRDNFFSFEFAALDFRNPGRNRYSYLLEGVDPEWVDAGSRRYVGYTNVAPGSYVFRVKAASSDGVWNDVGHEIAIHIAPPFWQTWWFRLGSLLALVVAAVSFHRLRLRSIRLRAEELEVEVAHRTAEVRAQKEELGRQHKRLEVVNGIVQLINAETNFDDLLGMILEGVSFAEGAEKALAVVRDKATETYEVRADFGWTEGAPTAVTGLTREEIERGYLGSAKTIRDSVWLGRPGEGRLFSEEERLGRPSVTILALRIDIGLDAAGYLIFGKIHRGDEFSLREAEVLADLQQHVASAFRKGRLLEELTALNEKKNEFLGVAAHDLRSPLGGVISYTDLLLRFLDEGRDDPAIWRRFLSNVRTTADQMRTLVNNLLDVTAIESGKLDLQVKIERIDLLIEERAAFHERAAAAKRIDLRVDVSDVAREVLVDKVRIAEVLDNLVSNAIKFTAPGGSVSILGELLGEEILIHVEDTGQGLLQHELSQLFDGNRLSARPTGGERSTGLGLVIVKKIVELHRGEVWAESTKGQGSRFTFSLPWFSSADPPGKEDGP